MLNVLICVKEPVIPFVMLNTTLFEQLNSDSLRIQVAYNLMFDSNANVGPWRVGR